MISVNQFDELEMQQKIIEMHKKKFAGSNSFIFNTLFHNEMLEFVMDIPQWIDNEYIQNFLEIERLEIERLNQIEVNRVFKVKLEENERERFKLLKKNEQFIIEKLSSDQERDDVKRRLDTCEALRDTLQQSVNESSAIIADRENHVRRLTAQLEAAREEMKHLGEENEILRQDNERMQLNEDLAAFN